MGGVAGTSILPLLVATVMAYCVTGYVRDELYHPLVKGCVGGACSFVVREGGEGGRVRRRGGRGEEGRREGRRKERGSEGGEGIGREREGGRREGEGVGKEGG